MCRIMQYSWNFPDNEFFIDINRPVGDRQITENRMHNELMPDANKIQCENHLNELFSPSMWRLASPRVNPSDGQAMNM